MDEDHSAPKVLVTGGAGYIGSHAVLELLGAGYRVVVLDNLSNSSAESLRRVAELSGKPAPLVVGDIRDRVLVTDLLAREQVQAVIHFAGLKAVGESVEQPLAYYDNNVNGTTVLLECLAAAGVRALVFSSSATVYGDPRQVPVPVDAPLAPTNPYGQTKAMVEQILGDLAVSDPRWALAILRYFNPVGAHPSGRIGEDPQGIPNNLMPYVSQVAVGRHPELAVFGGDYPTPDGTGVRDYIHVVDLARGHVAALARVLTRQGAFTVNLGTGRGHSVLEIARAFEAASGRQVPYRIVGRRPGDIAQCYADPSSALQLLGWQAELGLEAMCADAWRWQSDNPRGYGEAG